MCCIGLYFITAKNERSNYGVEDTYVSSPVLLRKTFRSHAAVSGTERSGSRDTRRRQLQLLTPTRSGSDWNHHSVTTRVTTPKICKQRHHCDFELRPFVVSSSNAYINSRDTAGPTCMRVESRLRPYSQTCVNGTNDARRTPAIRLSQSLCSVAAAAVLKRVIGTNSCWTQNEIT